jgi:hypothetical protein
LKRPFSQVEGDSYLIKKSLNQLPFLKIKNNKKEDGCSYNERKRKMRKVKRLKQKLGTW